MMRTYTLTIQHKTRHEELYGTLRCTRCGAEVMVGDELTQRTPTQRYHKACYEDLIHIPEKVERLESRR